MYLRCMYVADLRYLHGVGLCICMKYVSKVYAHSGFKGFIWCRFVHLYEVCSEVYSSIIGFEATVDLRCMHVFKVYACI